MDKKKLIVAIVIPLIIGLVLGYILGVTQVRPIVKESAEKKVTLPESKVILDWTATAHGQVTKIFDRTLILNNEGDELTIPIKKDAMITAPLILPGEPVEPEQEALLYQQRLMKFEEIKVGNRVDVFVELTPEGTFRGINIVIIPE